MTKYGLVIIGSLIFGQTTEMVYYDLGHQIRFFLIGKVDNFTKMSKIVYHRLNISERE